VDCRGVQRFAGEAIDRSLPQDVAAEFQAHLEQCPPCRREVTLERVSKFLVQQYVRWVTTPRTAQSAVLGSLREEYSRSETSALSYLGGMLPPHILVPVFMGGAVAFLFFALVRMPFQPTHQATAHTAGNDIINLSFKNLALLKSGRLEPTLVSTIPESVGTYLQRADLQFTAHVPALADCGWCGGAITERGGIKQAHVIYGITSDLVYVFEVSWNDALSGGQLSMPPAARRGLAQSGWYTDPDYPGCSVVLWKTDEAVCVAVSTMNKGRLLSLLTTR
jgi:hypothetical protein